MCWCQLEVDLHGIINILNFQPDRYIVVPPPPAWTLGYARKHVTSSVAAHQAKVSREWIIVITAAICYHVLVQRTCEKGYS